MNTENKKNWPPRVILLGKAISGSDLALNVLGKPLCSNHVSRICYNRINKADIRVIKFHDPYYTYARLMLMQGIQQKLYRSSEDVLQSP